MLRFTTTFTCLNTKRIKYRIITVNINNFRSCFTLLITQLIEIQLNEFTLVKLDRIVNSIKNTFLMNRNILYYIIFLHQIRMNILNIINISRIIINTKIIHISIKPCFFILSIDQSFEIFPKHNGVATISEPFALNL